MSEPTPDHRTGMEVAVIGLSGRFPGANSINEFWQNLRNGVESISLFADHELESSVIDSDVPGEAGYVKARGIIDGIELFDASFFGFSPREAEITDPQQRLFLECAWEALESAGYDSDSYKGSIGTFAGVSMSAYLLNLYSNPDLLKSLNGLPGMIAVDKDHLSTRVAYKMNLRGPSVTVQSACSTSLVAVHFAIQSLLSGECDMAMAGGASILIPQKSGYFYQSGGTFSPDGHCRAFDVGAQGTVASNGVGIVLLKRLEDALADRDCIYAVVKGSALNNDGSSKVGYTAPSIDGQASVIRAAQIVAEVDPESISYIEAHGTGTVLGDPIEIAALTQAFRQSTSKKCFCAIGSVKTNIGHLDAAAGIAGFIKTVLALKHKLIPPSLNFSAPNPKIDFENSPFYVNDRLREWEAGIAPRRAGVSSFGIGGTNAHAILQEAPAIESSAESRPSHLLLLSAKTESALDAATQNLADHLLNHSDIVMADVAHTLQVGRKAFSHRRMLVCSDREDAAGALESLSPTRLSTSFHEGGKVSVAFLFPGQGSQQINMGLELYRIEPSFRAEVDTCSEILKEHLGLDLRSVLFPGQAATDDARQLLNQTFMTQPALFVIEYSLAKLWMKWGVRPWAMIGHSIGEYVAACLAGVFSLEDALALVAARGRLMQQLPAGAMLAVALTEEQARARLRDGVSLAAINAPSFCVVSGPEDAINALQDELSSEGVPGRRLQTSHAFHSEMMEPITGQFAELIKAVNLNAPRIAYMSNVTGDWITPAQVSDPAYWTTHLRQTVRFADGLAELLKSSDAVLLEVGPGETLSKLARRHAAGGTGQRALSSVGSSTGQQGEYSSLLNALGRLWLAGARPDWAAFYDDQQRRRIALPTYPFERQPYWIETRRQAGRFNGTQRMSSRGARQTQPSGSKHMRPSIRASYISPRNEVEQTLATIWQDIFGIEQVGVEDNFFDLGGDSLLAVQLISRLQKEYSIELPMHSVMGCPTIAKLSGLFGGGSPSMQVAQASKLARSQLLVEIQRGGPHRPLFLIHPVGGGIFGYYDLAQLLGAGQAVYGIRARGLDGEEEPFTDVEDRSAYYIKLVRDAQPEGPYFLGGASFGGTVAFEMARQLRKQNQEVALLALFDALGPGHMPAGIQDDAAILAFIAGDSLEVSLDCLRRLEPDEQLLTVFDQMKAANRLPSDLDLSQARRIFRIWKANFEAMFRYRPEAYPGRITFFRANDRSGGYTPNPELAWVDMAGEGIEIYVTPGGHNSMLLPPHVSVVAERLKRLMVEVRNAI